MRTPEALASLDAFASLGRALGYWSGAVNLDAVSDTLRTAAGFSSTYVPASNSMVIEAKDGAAALSPVQRAGIIITLASILDDQQFHVLQRLARIRVTQPYEALAGVADVLGSVVDVSGESEPPLEMLAVRVGLERTVEKFDVQVDVASSSSLRSRCSLPGLT